MTAQAADYGAALEAMPMLFDEPFGDSAAWSNFLIAQFARREVKVALSGEGGDEIFCGYPRYWSHVGERSNFLTKTLAEFLPPLSRFGSSMQSRAYVGLEAQAAALGGLNAVQVDALLGENWREADYDYLWFYRKFWRPDLQPLAQLRWLDLNTDLADGLLTKVDRSSMAHSLEVRPPLLDHRLVEFMLTVDPKLLVDPARERGKLLVRELMAPRLPPGTWIDRSRASACRCDPGSNATLACSRMRCSVCVSAACCAGRSTPNFGVPGSFSSWIAGSPLSLEDVVFAASAAILVVPVSGPYGMGEYMRLLAIARAASVRWPEASVHFVLSRDAPYAADAPFPATLVPSSPTFHSPAVIELIEQFRPTVVLFDNAGRTAQLRAAKRSAPT